jgi:hypothetical protein
VENPARHTRKIRGIDLCLLGLFTSKVRYSKSGRGVGNLSRFVPIRPDSSRFVPIRPDSSRFVPIPLENFATARRARSNFFWNLRQCVRWILLWFGCGVLVACGVLSCVHPITFSPSKNREDDEVYCVWRIRSNIAAYRRCDEGDYTILTYEYVQWCTGFITYHQTSVNT